MLLKIKEFPERGAAIGAIHELSLRASLAGGRIDAFVNGKEM